MCFILLLFVFYRVQVSMSFRECSNIFLADQDERQRCFFVDQKQFPADHWSAVISSPVVAIRDVVSGNNLPDIHIRTLKDVAISEFIPSSEDVQHLKKDMWKWVVSSIH